MKEIIRLIAVLTLISATAGIMLAYTNKVTRAPIETAMRKETVAALAVVLPPFDNVPAACTNTVRENGSTRTFYVARKDGRYAGAAFEAASGKGYGGMIRLMVGVTADGTVRSVRILAQQETPGLGSKIAEPAFCGQFTDRPIEGTSWQVRKDGGAFDAVTGATISSRAVLEAIHEGLAAYQRHKDSIARTGE